MKQKIKEIIERDYKYYYRTIKRLYPDFFNQMNNRFRPLSENIYCWLYNDDKDILCKCGNKLTFQSMNLGYFSHCSSKCAAMDDSVKQKRKNTNLIAYGVENTSQLPCTREKFYKTMNERYGVMHALQNSEFSKKSVDSFKKNDITLIKEKKETTNLERYGFRHASQNEKIKEKRVNTTLERYGVDTLLRNRDVIDKTTKNRRNSYMQNIETRINDVEPLFDCFIGVNNNGNRILYPWRCLKCNNPFQGHLDDGQNPRCPVCYPLDISKGQFQVQEYLKSLNIDISSNNKILISPLELDVVSDMHKIAIEYNGLYYHHDKKVDKNYHLNKTLLCKNIGYRLIHIFEGEWLNKRTIIESRIKSVFGLNEKIFARKTTISKLSHKETKNFLEKNHLQGMCPSSINLGLIHANELIAVMTFGKSRFDKNFDFELLRYASALGINVVGGASKLLSNFKKTHPIGSIISYSDNRWNTGNLYKNIGFQYSHTSPPNQYWSLDRINLLGRQNFQKHKLKEKLKIFDNNMYAQDNMYNNGYLRIWDCGNDVFTYVPH